MHRATLASLALVLLVVASASAQCNFAARQLYPLQDIIKCQNQVPFSDAFRQATLDTVSKVMRLYAFRDIVANSPQSGLSHVSVNLDAELARLASASYSSAYDFEEDLANVILALKDAHTLYTKSNCFQYFALQPFTLRSRMNAAGQQEIYVSDLYSYSKGAWTDLNLAQYVGATIVKINGNDAVKTLYAWGEEFEFMSKDPGNAFNAVLNGHYQQRIVEIFPLPDNGQQTFDVILANGQQTSVSIPWMALPLRNIRFGSSCTSINPAPINTAQMHQSPIERFHPSKLFPTITKAKKVEAGVRERSVLFSDAAQANGKPSLQVYNFTSDVMVVRIFDFTPDSDKAFLATLDTAFDYAENTNMPHLILDLRGNGGGSICLGYQVLWRLMHERHPEGDYDVVESALMRKMFAAGQNLGDGFLFGSGFFSGSNGQVFNDLSFYDSPKQYTRGGKTSNYTLPIHHACDYNTSYITDFLFKKIIVLTDGLCGSTCAVFSTHMDFIDHAETLVIGGLDGAEEQQYFSFPGGQVMSFDALQYYGGNMGLTRDPSWPKPFPNGAGLSFTFLEIYPWQLPDDPMRVSEDRFESPLEFVFHPADHRLSMWTFTDDDDSSLWNAIIPYFTSSKK